MLSKELILEVLNKKEGHDYAPFRVYVPTSAPSGNCYVRYNMEYQYSDVRDNYKPCSTTNVSNYRIREAHLVRVDAVEETSVRGEELCKVLQQGEISLAIREDLEDTAHLARDARPIEKNGECFSADFIGGYHGDERLTDVALAANGKAIDLTGDAPRALSCKELDFTQTTLLYRWGTSNAESYGTPVAEHTQHMRFRCDGVRNKQALVWLCDDFHARKNATFLQMFTMKRMQNEAPVCEIVETFGEGGETLGRVCVPLQPEKDHVALPHPAARSVKYSSAESDISAEVGFRILNDSLRTDNTWIQVRTSQGDNKWYASFSSPQNGHMPQRGERWELELFAHIDYAGQ